MFTVLQISICRTLNSRQELILILALPIMFFSIFALIFSRGVGSGGKPLTVAVIDDDQSSLSQDLIKQIAAQDSIRKVIGGRSTSGGRTPQALARALLSRTQTDIVVHIPTGYADQVQSFTDAAMGIQDLPQELGDSEAPAGITLMEEGTNPVGKQLLTAVLTQAVATSAAKAGMADEDSNPTTDSPVIAASYSAEAPAAEDDPFEFEASIASENVFSYNKHQPKIAMYAAGIAVMFLLFSASGAGGSLLEEREAGTLDRLLCTRLTITQLLAGKWLYITMVGLVQLTVMFAWGQFAFGVDFSGHLPAFFALAVPTAAAAASFALLLAAVCRSRAQLNGVSVIVVLSMSALGGSMIPRYIMSESMQSLGKYTFNGWALDGFKKVFWYDLPVNMLTTEIIVLCTIAVVLGVVARTLALRWDAT